SRDLPSVIRLSTFPSPTARDQAARHCALAELPHRAERSRGTNTVAKLLIRAAPLSRRRDPCLQGTRQLDSRCLVELVTGKERIAMSTAVTLDPEKAYEIVDGQPEEKEMAGARHGSVIMRLGVRLGIHIEQHHLGGLYSPNTTFQIGRNERLPDL